jgi:hypothetical protein
LRRATESESCKQALEKDDCQTAVLASSKMTIFLR